MLKGLELVRPGYDLTRRALPYSVPVKDGLLGWWFFGQDQSLSSDNLVVDQPDASYINADSVEVEDYYFEVQHGSGNGQIDLGFGDTEEGSFALVCKNPNDGSDNDKRPFILASQIAGAPANGGLALAQTGANQVTLTVVRDSTSNGVNLASGSLTLADTWQLFVCTWNLAGQRVISLTDGLDSEDTFSASARTLGINNFRLGGIGSASLQKGEAYIAHVSIANRIWTDNEIAVIAERLRSYYARRGITI